jgi:2-alkyl-3-oxoalkanoate reductase
VFVAGATGVIGIRTGPMANVVLRFGFLYGSGRAFAADGSVAAQMRRRRFPIVGGGTGTFSFVHVEDAAEACLRAAVGGPSGIYNVVDDEPAPARVWIPVYANALGASKPHRVPKIAGQAGGGPYPVFLRTQLRGASNAAAREGLGWYPQVASWRTGFAETLR